MKWAENQCTFPLLNGVYGQKINVHFPLWMEFMGRKPIYISLCEWSLWAENQCTFPLLNGVHGQKTNVHFPFWMEFMMHWCGMVLSKHNMEISLLQNVINSMQRNCCHPSPQVPGNMPWTVHRISHKDSSSTVVWPIQHSRCSLNIHTDTSPICIVFLCCSQSCQIWGGMQQGFKCQPQQRSIVNVRTLNQTLTEYQRIKGR